MPYIGKSPSAGVRQRYQYTATAGQTTFSGTDLGNLTLTYTDNNFVDVFQNGVLLKGGGTDYTATSGTSVVLATGASVSEVIEIIVYDVFSVGNFYNRTDSDSRYALNEGGVVFNETSADVDFRVESNGNANMLFVDGGNDSVVIGHSDANDGSVSSAFALQNIGTDYNSSSMGLARFSADVNAPTVAFHKSRNASIGGDTVVQDDDELGRIRFFGNDGTDFAEGARITALVNGTPGSGDMPSELVFSTSANGAETPTDRMTITRTGQVGINETPVTTAGSAAYLHIDSDGRYNANTQSAIFQSTSNRGTVRIRTIGDEAAELFWDSNGGARWLMSCRSSGASHQMSWYNAHSTPSYTSVGSAKMVLTQAGNLSVTGSLSKGSGSFKIDHPLESKKDTHHLVHSFIEGPQADLIYRGKATLSSGTATVNIDTVSGMTSGTFVALNTNVQCFTNNESGWTAVKGSVDGNTLTITAQDNSCTDTISWMVIGERQDPHMKDSETNWTDSDGKVILEPEKESEE